MVDGRRDPLTVAVAQPPCTARDVAKNAAVHAAVVRSTDARVVVFPELSLTGYEFEASPVALNDDRLAPIVAACAETGRIALVGAPVDGPSGRPNIATLAVGPDGASVAYRKVCLGGAEPQQFEAGTDPAVLTVDGWRLGLAICKDTGVPEHATRTIALGIDAYVASVLEHASDAAVIDERAGQIALRHNVWAAMASFAGSTGGGYEHAAGRSGIWAPDGLVHARAGQDAGSVVTATLEA